MTVTDNDLALAAANGDRSAFAALIERVYDRVFGLAFRLTGSRAEAEDLTQDICAALPAKLRRFDGRSALTTWLYRVVLNAAHDARRRRATYAKATSGWGDWEVARKAEAQEADEVLDWLSTAMAALPDDLRDTLALVLDDMTHADAGEVLGVSEGTVSWRLSRARKLLREMKEAGQ